LCEAGHRFEWARFDWGFEEGTFVDGAFLSTVEVIELAALSPAERNLKLAEIRRDRKHEACYAVKSYMGALHVSFDELIASQGLGWRGRRESACAPAPFIRIVRRKRG
jgi:hypothetical protein